MRHTNVLPSDVVGGGAVHQAPKQTSLWASFTNQVVQRLYRWHALAKERKALSQLNDRMLKDIGITRADVERESRRFFWDEPR